MPISRTDEYERIMDTSTIADSYARRLNAYPNPYKKEQSVQEYVDTLIDKAGMTDYIKQINSELSSGQTKKATDQKITNILQIPEIKKSIDDAIENNIFSTPIPLIVELQKFVKADPKVPEELKDVMGNEELRKYIVEKMKFGDQEDVKYELGTKTKNIDSSKGQGNTDKYYSFESSDESNK